MKNKTVYSILACLLACLLSNTVFAQSQDIKLEAQLIWGTNDPKSPDPQHKVVQDEVKKRLTQLPLKFTNFFMIDKKSFALPQGEVQKVELGKCRLDVKKAADNQVEVSLYGKGEKVVKRTQPLPKGEMLVLGGNAPNETAWLVVVKRLD